MDTFPERRKKSDKAKEKIERNGYFNKKHVRIQAAVVEKRAVTKPVEKK
jgi:hypothetical protein